MTTKRDAVLHDAGSLFRFVDSVCTLCRVPSESPSYLPPSHLFFEYIQHLGKKTEIHLQALVAGLDESNTITFDAERQKLADLRSIWFEIHKLIRPAVDAHSLNIPYPLLISLLRRFGSIPNFSGKQFLILHTDTVNYFEAHSTVRELFGELQEVIPDAPPFPANLGIIEFPYSQAESVFLNCLIAHEMGHFFFQELAQPKPSAEAGFPTPYDEILGEIRKNLKQTFGPDFDRMTETELKWCIDRLLGWTEEVFCDFFAIWMVGPCFSLAYIELLDVAVRLYPSPLPSKAYAKSPQFTLSHPARLFRLREHVRMLKKLGWWPEIATLRTHYISLLEAASENKDSDFQFNSKDEKRAALAPRTLKAFYPTTERLLDIVARVMKGMNPELESYRRHHRAIERYLSHGIVPSTVLVERQKTGRWPPLLTFAGKPTEEHPDFVSILNASYKFYLESLPKLIEDIEEQDPSSMSHRNKWIKQLERWTMKAIEDSELWARTEGR